MRATQAHQASTFAAPTRARWIVPAWSFLLALVILGPLIRPGWVLLLDWVVGPRSDFSDRIFSGSSLPAGPAFFGTAALIQAVLGGAVGWALPLLLLVVGGIGAGFLVLANGSGLSTLAACTAATAYIWNPFVHERLYSGQLAVLAGYAIVPYLVALSLRTVGNGAPQATRRGTLAMFMPGFVWALGAASSIHYAVLGGIVVATVAGVTAACEPGSSRASLRWMLEVSAVAVIITATWLVPVLDDAPPTGNQQTIAAFATRPDPNLGLGPGVVFQTGFWRPSPGEPNSTLGWWWPLIAGSLGGAALIGLVSLARSKQKRCAFVAGFLAIVGWLLGQGGDGPVGQLFRVLTDVPTFRVMREAGKFVALLSLAWAVGLAGCADLVSRSIRSSPQLRSSRVFRLLTLFVVIMPIGLTPGLAWGVGGRLDATDYPPAWSAIQRELERSRNGDVNGDVIVIPFVGYFDPGFTNNRVVRNPAKAYFGSRVVLSDDAQIEGLPPSTSTRQVAAALRSREPGKNLAKLGIGWVVVASKRLPTTEFDLVLQVNDWMLFRVKAFKAERQRIG